MLATNTLTRNRRSSEMTYTPHIEVGFRRVTALNPCPVCKRTKWCQVTRDGRLAHCMWQAVGAVKRAKDDGYIHVLIDDDIQSSSRRYTEKTLDKIPTRSSELAPLEIRDAVYSKLIELSPVWRYERDLVTSERGLLARGFSRDDLRRFGALPPRVAERDALARMINEMLEDDYPFYAAGRSVTAVYGVPGFWDGAEGRPKLGRATNYKRPALVIPYRDRAGSIQACQLRFCGKSGKSLYSWLSTAEDKAHEEPRGTSSGCPIHFAAREGQSLPDLAFLITEGALKAEAFVSQRSAMRVIATAGVSVAHAEIIAATRNQDAAIGFDIDHRQNAQVCRQLARLIAGRETDAQLSGHKTNTSVVVWEGPKGIDDAVLMNVHLRVITAKNWRETLTGKSLEAVNELWTELSFVPASD